MSADDPLSRFIAAPDGLRLHALEFGGEGDEGTPVVCLPGLTRPAADFAALARALRLNGKKRRRVLALDYRGRGQSAWDRDPAHYAIPIEQGDILAALEAFGVKQAIFVGTSRGGLHTMILALAKPGLARAAVLNDIGPVIEMAGLMRIKGYLGRLPHIGSYGEAAAFFKASNSAEFPAVSESDWLTYARLTLKEAPSGLKLRYDPQLAHTYDAVDPDAPQPHLWRQFEALASAPLLVLRGENSDILSAATLAEMSRRHKACQSFIVPGQGHAPLLLDASSHERVTRFIDEADA